MKFDALYHWPVLGISSALSCSSVRARAICTLHGWRRIVKGRLVDRGTTPLIREIATGGVELEPRHVRRHRLSNHRVEVNRHQPSCLPSRFDFMIAGVHSNVHGQVAVTHPGRSATTNVK